MDSKSKNLAAKQQALAAGQQAETQACEYLKLQGLQLLERNFRCKYGEIDLIMQQNDIIVFVEVKYRQGQHFGGALLSLQRRQQQRIIRAAQFFLMRYPNHQARFDLVAIDGDQPIQWVANAFDAG